ncbi:hypothetical protein PVAND_016482 [Polypedilum vanderplanki]|uniref:C-type lectin domain-containing protein n=1 Tax=Polypedilum vanderplanki TaxID=319348 RepID=A0A9J6BFX8_POLVA|nr:hypothetical protein PVAND_016482 [Polypedilum vanderplanki]
MKFVKLMTFLFFVNFAFSQDLSKCSTTSKLIDINGRYVNSVCFVRMSVVQAEAAEICQSLDMKLLTIFKFYELNALNLLSLSFDNFWISGTKINENYVDTNDGVTPLNTSFYNIDDTNEGNCLFCRNFLHITFDILSYPCNSLNYFLCEFDDSSIKMKSNADTISVGTNNQKIQSKNQTAEETETVTIISETTSTPRLPVKPEHKQLNGTSKSKRKGVLNSLIGSLLGSL